MGRGAAAKHRDGDCCMTYAPHPWDKYGGPGARKTRAQTLRELANTALIIVAALGMLVAAMWLAGQLVPASPDPRREATDDIARVLVFFANLGIAGVLVYAQGKYSGSQNRPHDTDEVP